MNKISSFAKLCRATFLIPGFNKGEFAFSAEYEIARSDKKFLGRDSFTRSATFTVTSRCNSSPRHSSSRRSEMVALYSEDEHFSRFLRICLYYVIGHNIELNIGEHIAVSTNRKRIYTIGTCVDSCCMQVSPCDICSKERFLQESLLSVGRTVRKFREPERLENLRFR